jgi:hypothetical protein
MDKTTGYVSEDELIQLAEAPEDSAGGVVAPASTWACVSVVVSAASAISSAVGDACPTTACTTRC